MQTILPNRGVLALAGEDRIGFLQGLVSNDVRLAGPDRIIYACLLTPQGRFLHDMFIYGEAERLLIECEADRRDDLLKRLKMFALRAKIALSDVTADYRVEVAWPGGDGLADPRHAGLGSRKLVFMTPSKAPIVPSPPQGGEGNEDLAARSATLVEVGEGESLRDVAPSQQPFTADPLTLASLSAEALSSASPLPHMGSEGIFTVLEQYDRHRLRLGIPDGSRDMVVGDALLMENNIDTLHGIAWDKGCYMGQELTARMKYRGLVKKGLRIVTIEGPALAVGTILLADGKEIGEMRSSNGDAGLALLRLDFGGERIVAGKTCLTPLPA